APGPTADVLITSPPDLRAEAGRIVSKSRLGPIFTPPSVSRAEGPIATLTRGAQAAATNWPGGSFDPELHPVFVASQTSVATAGLVAPPPGISDFKYFQGTVLSGARLTGGSGSGAGAAATPGAGGRGPTVISGGGGARGGGGGAGGGGGTGGGARGLAAPD